MIFPVEDKCSLCGAEFPSFLLNRCSRCGRLYCNNCIIQGKDGEPICLNCAKKIITPKILWRSKYTYLREYLASKAIFSERIRLSFRRIEEIIGDRLPQSAYNNPEWWSNRPGRSHSESWLSVGWTVEKINLEKKEVIFRRIKPIERNSKGKRRHKRLSEEFKSLALRRERRKRIRSKRKITEAIIRMKNLKRRLPQEKLRLNKQRSAYQKRLYRLDVKPE